MHVCRRKYIAWLRMKKWWALYILTHVGVPEALGAKQKKWIVADRATMRWPSGESAWAPSDTRNVSGGALAINSFVSFVKCKMIKSWWKEVFDFWQHLMQRAENKKRPLRGQSAREARECCWWDMYQRTNYFVTGGKLVFLWLILGFIAVFEFCSNFVIVSTVKLISSSPSSRGFSGRHVGSGGLHDPSVHVTCWLPRSRAVPPWAQRKRRLVPSI